MSHIIQSYSFKLTLRLQSFLSFNCHSNVNVLILVKIEAAAAACETECLSKKISPCTMLQNSVEL